MRAAECSRVAERGDVACEGSPPPSFAPAVMVTHSHGDIEMGFDRRNDNDVIKTMETFLVTFP